METAKRQVLETGLTKEFLGSGSEKRDPVQEFEEDHELLSRALDFLLSDADRMVESLKGQKNTDIVTQAELVKEGLGDFKKRLDDIANQAELFTSEPDLKGNEISVKLKQLTAIKKELRDWYTMVGGIKNLGAKTTHDFPKVEDLSSAIFSKDKKQVYGRSFNEEVTRWEKTFKKEFNVEVALCNSGMSAIESCLRAADLKPGDVILVGREFYTQTKVLIAELEGKGIKVVQVDVSDLKNVEENVNKYLPKIVLFEGIGNAVSMQTADLDGLLSANSDWNGKHPEQPSRLLVDNTFVNITLSDLGRRVKDLKLKNTSWAGLESATKYYQLGMDNITAGIVYSDDEQFIESVRGKRGSIGEILQERLASYLPPPDAEMMEKKMFRHSMNAMLLANHLEQLGLKVQYPGLKTHAGSDLAEKNFPDGVGGVFYIAWDNKFGNPQQFVNQVKKEAEEIGIEIKIGVSFGHQETWLETLPPDRGNNWNENDQREWAVRVMAGEENVAEMKKVLEAFEKALRK